MSQTIRPVFTLDLGCKVAPGHVAVGKYDGVHPCLTVATTADKVLIHSPHRRSNQAVGRLVWSEANRETAVLNLNHSITAIEAGRLLPDDDKDILIIGSATHLLAYHVHNNSDVFYRDCPDGVRAVRVAGQRAEPVLLVGGNSAVHCYDAGGLELFWTAVGDAVTGLLYMDFTGDGKDELVVSSEDFNIRVYKQDRLLSEQAETEMVTGLTLIKDNRYAYSVSNGTIGVYEKDLRLWRVKSKNFAISMVAFDLLDQGTPQLLTGWSNGKVDCRSVATGEVYFKDSLGSGAAGLVQADYRGTGKNDLICVSTEGEVRGYCTTKLLTQVAGSNPEQEQVRELLAKKQALLLEMAHYENNARYNDPSTLGSGRSDENMGVIPASTRLQIGIATDQTHKPCVEISIATNNDTIVRAVIVFAEGIFKGETLVVHPPESKLSSHLCVPLYPPKDIPVDIHIKAFIGYKFCKQYHVFELTRQLPRFAMYALAPPRPPQSAPPPRGSVEFRVTERLQRLCMWLNQSFLLDADIEPGTDPELRVWLKGLRDGAPLGFTVDATGKVTVKTGNMGLAADIIRSLAGFLNLENLQSTADFPEEETKLRELMERLTEIQDARLRLGINVADNLGQIRALVIKAEDSRINSIKDVAGCYVQLNHINSELINGFQIRLANYNEGLEAMKSINALIQTASRLRVGKYAADMIANCRSAIKANSVESLTKIIRTGSL